MRKKLEPHLGSYVLCRGWVGDWEDLYERQPVRRVLVRKPTIKKPNRDLVFKDLPTISTEHHLNLFINQGDLKDYKRSFYDKKKNVFELNSSIAFTGIIDRYTRKDGSKDYGIYPTKQSLFHYKLEELGAYNHYFSTKGEGVSEELYDFSQRAKHNLHCLLNGLEDVGNELPTFEHTYDWYKQKINEWLHFIQIRINWMDTAVCNRQNRRKLKISDQLKTFITTYEITY